MNSKPILIIVPTLNSYKILNKLVNSIKSQTYKNLRVIFIDGPSNDIHKSYLREICSSERNFFWYTQSKHKKFIFGAMNQGFEYAKNDEWIMFLGSDDLLPSNQILEIIINKISNLEMKNQLPDLLIGEARYINTETNKFGRISKFFKVLNFRTSLFLGLTPPHQATIFGPKAINFLNKFSEKITLTADLDYFLKLSLKKDLKFELINKQIIFLGEGGVSGRNTIKRTKQVLFCYFKAFKIFLFVPFIFRYLFRVFYFLKNTLRN